MLGQEQVVTVLEAVHGTDFFHLVLSLHFLSVFGLLLQLLLIWLLIGRALARCRYRLKILGFHCHLTILCL